ncbi:MAG TPA: nucleoside triphosphate pyrophosphatase [Candidatus Nanopelagicales bacterium]|jgi:septum formation protein
MRTLVLASASPARKALLISAGITPYVQVSDVDEPALQAQLLAGGVLDPAGLCQELAVAKARSTAAGVRSSHPGALVVGCDSVLDLDGRAWGKPADGTEVLTRWSAMAGRSGVLRTGHHVVDLATGAEVGATASTVVRFGRPDPAELAAYVASGEPLRVAGAFTLDGLGAAFVDGVDGDPSNVVGLSLPTLRGLLSRLGVRWTDLWS